MGNGMTLPWIMDDSRGRFGDRSRDHNSRNGNPRRHALLNRADRDHRTGPGQELGAAFGRGRVSCPGSPALIRRRELAAAIRARQGWAVHNQSVTKGLLGAKFPAERAATENRTDHLFLVGFCGDILGP
jgi:hypothetical protein